MDMIEAFVLVAGSHSLKHVWFGSCLARPDRCQDLSVAIHKRSDVVCDLGVIADANILSA